MSSLTPSGHNWQPHYVLKRQIFKLVGSNFFVYDSGGTLQFFVHQKGFKLKEDVRVYTNESKTQEVMRISARKVMDFSGAYDVFDSATNERVGVLKRKGWRSIARDEWTVCGPQEQEIGTLIEDNLALALLRRLATNLIPQNYDLLINGVQVMDFKQNFNPFSYHLNIDFKQLGAMEPRLGIACAIMLASMEGRQS